MIAEGALFASLVGKAPVSYGLNNRRGASIAGAIVTEFRNRNSLLPEANLIERMGIAARAIARRRAEKTLIEGLSSDSLQDRDRLLEVDQTIGQTRFHWLRSAPDAPSASNLVGLTECITYLRTLG